MEEIAVSLIVKIIIMMIFVILLFLATLFFYKYKFMFNTKKQYCKVINTAFLNNKDKVIDFQYKDKIYLVYVNQNSCILLDKKVSEDIPPFEKKSSKNHHFKDIISKVYKL